MDYKKKDDRWMMVDRLVAKYGNDHEKQAWILVKQDYADELLEKFAKPMRRGK